MRNVPHAITDIMDKYLDQGRSGPGNRIASGGGSEPWDTYMGNLFMIALGAGSLESAQHQLIGVRGLIIGNIRIF